jgi:NhaP-type Na+/H+ or K+/H+ antiporter
MIAQLLARHFRIPGIVVLLAAGVLLGPDVAGIVRPSELGGALNTLVGFAVAVILFEGGIQLNIRRLRRQASSIRRLVTLGAVITALGGALTGRFIMQCEWTPSILFGTLVIVTGPTVINPLLRRIRVRQNLSTVLMAEGVFVDAVGAIIAVVALETVLSPSGGSLSSGLQHFALRLSFGIAIGALVGFALSVLLRFEFLVPDGLENALTLSLVLALFQLCNLWVPESGIMAVTVAGVVIGNSKTRALEDLKDFKEQLTVLLIGMLFVLLAADIRVDDIAAVGPRGILAVLALMLVVRPMNVFASTIRSGLNFQEKAFLAWMAPRGIVAAAIASLFAQRLDAAGIAGGIEIRTLVFCVIAATVVIQGLSGGMVAGLLGVRRPSNSGYVILGASPLGITLAQVLKDSGQEVVLLDSNPAACAAAQAAGHRVLFGNALSDSLLLRAQPDSRAGCLAVTPNEEINLIFARRCKETFKVANVWAALKSGRNSVTPQMVSKVGAHVLFGRPRRTELWSIRTERNLTTLETWVAGDKTTLAPTADREAAETHKTFLPLAVKRGKRTTPIGNNLEFNKGDEVSIIIFRGKYPETVEWLQSRSWLRVDPIDPIA